MVRSSDIPAMTGATARGRRQRSWRVLSAAVVFSVTLHAALFAAWPGLVRDRAPTKVSVLDVVVLKPEPLPVAAPEPVRVPAEVTRAVSDRKKVEQRKPRVDDAPGPGAREPARSSMVAPVESPAAAEAAPAPPAVEARAGPAEQKAEATAALTPPTYNAAYFRNPPPRYPLVARRNGEQGTVTLRVLVTRDGLPASVTVEKTSGSTHLDSAALETVRTWRFMPARRGAQPVEAWVLVPIVFKLEGVS